MILLYPHTFDNLKNKLCKTKKERNWPYIQNKNIVKFRKQRQKQEEEQAKNKDSNKMVTQKSLRDNSTQSKFIFKKDASTIYSPETERKHHVSTETTYEDPDSENNNTSIYSHPKKGALSAAKELKRKRLNFSLYDDDESDLNIKKSRQSKDYKIIKNGDDVFTVVGDMDDDEIYNLIEEQKKHDEEKEHRKSTIAERTRSKHNQQGKSYNFKWKTF